MTRGRRMFAIGFVAAATVPVVWILTRTSTGEPLTAERLAEARDLWARHGPRAYTLDVEAPDARHRIEVRDGKVVAMTTNGTDVPERVRDRWNVEGMFVFLSEEISNLRHPEAAFGVTDASEVLLRAEFDKGNGFPARFLRHVQGQTRSFEWKARLKAR